jgi:hypothetical protein
MAEGALDMVNRTIDGEEQRLQHNLFMTRSFPTKGVNVFEKK